MPEPDFDQIARGIVDGLYSPDDMADPDVEIPKVVADVAEQLRQVWNARGAADQKTITELRTKYQTYAARCGTNMRNVASGNVDRRAEGMRDAFNDVVADLDTLVDR